MQYKTICSCWFKLKSGRTVTTIGVVLEASELSPDEVDHLTKAGVIAPVEADPQKTTKEIRKAPVRKVRGRQAKDG